MALTSAPACKAALAEATRLWPNRNRASDGILSSGAHRLQSPNSDHDYGNAFDLTHDPLHGVDCDVLARRLTTDPRMKYIIWNRRIYNPSISRIWRPYSGSNPHTKHVHCSIHAGARGNTASWWGPQRPNPVVAEEVRVMSNAPFVAILVHPDGGYLRVGADGGMFGHDAPFFGSTGAIRLNAPIVDAAWTPTFQGYWLVGADGGVFGFGDAGWYGSTGELALNRPIVAIHGTGHGGYVLIAQDGGVFPFGPGAEFHGADPQWRG